MIIVKCKKPSQMMKYSQSYTVISIIFRKTKGLYYKGLFNIILKTITILSNVSLLVTRHFQEVAENLFRHIYIN